MSATVEKPPVNGTAPKTEPAAAPTIWTALLAFQAEAPTLPKNARNPHFNSKFTPLDTIVEIIGPLLNKHGLVWTAFPGRADDGEPVLNYRLVHAPSGMDLVGQMPLYPSKRDPQNLGSALTYMRRYAITAVLNLVADEDVDGAQLLAQVTQATSPTAASSVPVAEPPAAGNGKRLASVNQRGMLNAKASERGLTASQFANCMLLAAGAQEPRAFDSEEHAKAFVNRMLDRLPAELVTPTVEAIGASA